MQFIDYSQYSSFQFCPWRWYEHYVRGMSRRWDGQKDDALTLGTLVHNAMDNFSKYGKPEVDEPTLKEANPTPECYALAVRLVQGYLLKYPQESWPVEATEQPLMFPVRNGLVSWACPGCGHNSGASLSNFSGIVPGYGIPKTCASCGQRDYTVAVDEESIMGLAKLDGFFYVPEDTMVESYTLSRGWWAREYKTKSPGIDRNKWIREWQSKRQADFQILALQQMLGMSVRSDMDTTVQGVLVCVLEKPREHVPKRKCQGCKDTWEFSIYIPTPEGHLCPVCGHVNVFRAQKPVAQGEPEYFKITVVRKPEQLDQARREIAQVAMEMEDMRRRGMSSRAPDRDSCVSNRYHSECEFFNPHTYGGPVEEGQNYVKVDPLKYIGLPEEVTS